MISWQIQTLIKCDCGCNYYDIASALGVVPRTLKVISKPCPTCRKQHEYAYTFSADYSHKEKFGILQKAQLWAYQKDKGLPTGHYIKEHFARNKGTLAEVAYPSNCICGHEILLKQRRTK